MPLKWTRVNHLGFVTKRSRPRNAGPCGCWLAGVRFCCVVLGKGKKSIHLDMTVFTRRCLERGRVQLTSPKSSYKGSRGKSGKKKKKMIFLISDACHTRKLIGFRGNDQVGPFRDTTPASTCRGGGGSEEEAFLNILFSNRMI